MLSVADVITVKTLVHVWTFPYLFYRILVTDKSIDYFLPVECCIFGFSGTGKTWKSSHTDFYIAHYTIQIVSKQLHSDNQETINN